MALTRNTASKKTASRRRGPPGIRDPAKHAAAATKAAVTALRRKDVPTTRQSAAPGAATPWEKNAIAQALRKPQRIDQVRRPNRTEFVRERAMAHLERIHRRAEELDKVPKTSKLPPCKYQGNERKEEAAKNLRASAPTFLVYANDRRDGICDFCKRSVKLTAAQMEHAEFLKRRKRVGRVILLLRPQVSSQVRKSGPHLKYSTVHWHHVSVAGCKRFVAKEDVPKSPGSIPLSKLKGLDVSGLDRQDIDSVMARIKRCHLNLEPEPVREEEDPERDIAFREKRASRDAYLRNRRELMEVKKAESEQLRKAQRRQEYEVRKAKRIAEVAAAGATASVEGGDLVPTQRA
ncbi:hypothetical protein GLOTRDRAFT_134137 [Gloeophyllum trabeum ATCC 11539]|uniref:Uncharacterized protein n=1 Tax=Gloeophyllum trabeum (strain ATCC 11539 / FP-39264 / Madison 617) TaxID=670483 RepID=S7PQY3_GLOTA|nr:uncharacterized protein GLOTRDRAFT_134137 [Gloeophyllum trabeum ATCC 11539]EPQ50231.1 hypothetical protein GLOTRDRAFT_134137 [Gloeophyllum trabeum ATCC 11539]